MLKDITIGQYIPGESFIHRLDPRSKIIALMLYIIALFLLFNAIGYYAIVIFSVVIILASQVPVRIYLKGIRPLAFIIVLTMVLHFFMTPGTPIFNIGPLKVTQEGFYHGLQMGARLIILITVTSVLTLTTSPISLTDGIERLLNPLKKVGVPAHELAMMMTIALRFIPTLIEETEKIMKAQMARGADFESGNIIKRAKALIPLLVPLFVSAFRRADDLAMAMEARCYRGGENRTRMKQLKYTFIDFIAIIISMGFLVFAIYLRL